MNTREMGMMKEACKTKRHIVTDKRATWSLATYATYLVCTTHRTQILRLQAYSITLLTPL